MKVKISGTNIVSGSNEILELVIDVATEEVSIEHDENMTIVHHDEREKSICIEKGTLQIEVL